MLGSKEHMYVTTETKFIILPGSLVEAMRAWMIATTFLDIIPLSKFIGF